MRIITESDVELLGLSVSAYRLPSGGFANRVAGCGTHIVKMVCGCVVQADYAHFTRPVRDDAHMQGCECGNLVAYSPGHVTIELCSEHEAEYNA